MSLIWRIFSNACSLWVSWIQHYLLRQNSFWDIKDNGNGSWICRKLLKLRPHVYQFIRYEIHDGRTAFFWFDEWMKQGKLIDNTGEVGTCLLGVARTARVCDTVLQAGWNIRGHRSRFFHDLYDCIHSSLVPHTSNGSDVVLWKHSDGVYKPSFSSDRTWDQIRERKNTVFWSKGVWFSQGGLCFSFIVWLQWGIDWQRVIEWELGEFNRVVFCAESKMRLKTCVLRLSLLLHSMVCASEQVDWALDWSRLGGNAAVRMQKQSVKKG